MTDTTLTQLKMLVERTVRPVCASGVRQRRMREELLGHVMAVFDEELARTGDETSALQCTATRFGPADELTVELQATTSRNEWLLAYWEQFVYRPGESTLRRATRFASLALATLGPAFLTVFVSQHRLREWALIPATPTLIFCTTFLMHWTRQALCGPGGPRWGRLLIASVAAWLLIPTGTCALCLAFSGEIQPSLAAFRALLLPSLLAPLALIAVAPVMHREIQGIEEWASLEING